MPMLIECPAEDVLARMLDDSLSPEESGPVESHVASCVACQEVLERATARAEDSAPGWPSLGVEETRARTVPLAEVARAEGNAPWPDPPGYRIERELGRGGMGVVYLAHQVNANRAVALKMVLAGRGRPEDLLRFRIEGESLARLQHPNIVQVHEVGVSEGRPFFSMEFVRGGTLAESIRSTPRGPREAAALVEVLARAVHAAHQGGVVHRDLKPANVLIAAPDAGSQTGTSPGAIKITDFGLAKQVGSDSGLTHTGQILGTPSYMAPEQATSGASVGVPADVYALGAILYELFCGRPPFRGDSAWETMLQAVYDPVVPPSRSRPGIPGDLERICLKCLAKPPSGRYASADALAEDLHRFLDSRPILARPTGPAERLWLWCRRSPATAALTAALFVALAAGAAGAATQWLRAERGLVALGERTRQAEANATLARRAVDDLLTKVSEDRLLAEPGLQGLRRSLLQAAVPFYRELAANAGAAAGPGARAALAEALVRQAELEHDVGSMAEAEALAARAVVAAPGDDRASRVARATALRYLALVRTGLGQTANALATSLEAVALLEALERESPGDQRVKGLLAHALHDRGYVLMELDRLGESEAAYRRGLGLIEASKNDFTRSRPAATHRSLGDLLMRVPGRQADALAEFEAAVAIFDEAARQRPADLWAADDLASCLNYLGQMQGAVLGQHAQAVTTLERARAIIEPLVRENPGVASLRHELGQIEYTRGYSLMRLGRYGEALAAERSALDLIARLAREHPRDAVFRSPGLAGIHLDLAELARLMGDTVAARRSVGESRFLQEAAVSADPANTNYRLNLAMVHRYAGAIEADAGIADVALAEADAALALVGPLASGPSAAAHSREERDRALVVRGQALRLAGRPAEAQEAFGLAAEDLAALVALDPTAEERRALMAEALVRRAVALHVAGRGVEALANWVRARDALASPPPGPEGLHLVALLHAARAMLPPAPGTADPGAAADLTLDALRRSASAGYRNTPALRTDPDLELARALPQSGDLFPPSSAGRP